MKTEKVLKIPGEPTRELVVGAITERMKHLVCAHACAILEHGPDSPEAQLCSARVQEYLQNALEIYENRIKRGILARLSGAVGISVLGMSTPPHKSSVAKAAAPPAPKKPKTQPKRKAKAATNPSTKNDTATVEKLEVLILKHLPNDGSGISGAELLKRIREEPGRAATTAQQLRYPARKLVQQKWIQHNGAQTNARRWSKNVTNHT